MLIMEKQVWFLAKNTLHSECMWSKRKKLLTERHTDLGKIHVIKWVLKNEDKEKNYYVILKKVKMVVNKDMLLPDLLYASEE